MSGALLFSLNLVGELVFFSGGHFLVAFVVVQRLSHSFSSLGESMVARITGTFVLGCLIAAATFAVLLAMSG